MNTKLPFCSMLFFAATIIPSFSQTSIPAGPVSGTWTKAKSPYQVQGSITVEDATTLTVEAGVKVEFKGSFKLDVRGKVLAIGTEADSITFTASDTAVGWLGIDFIRTSTANDTSRFNYCRFTYGKTVITATDPSLTSGGAFYLDGFSKVVVSDSRISNCRIIEDGAAIFCKGSSPIIRNNLITNNWSKRGCIYLIGTSNPLIIKNTISYNLVNEGAGILCDDYCQPFITQNIITHNTAWVNGGGIVCRNNSSVKIINNTISYNKAVFEGNPYISGGISLLTGTHEIKGNKIDHNSSNGPGGAGIFCRDVTISIRENTISNNTSTNPTGISAGGIYSWGKSVSIVNNIIDSNTVTTYGGGGIFCKDGMEISNNFIVNNSANSGAGGIFNNVDLKISDNVIANNAVEGNGGGGIFCMSSSPTISNNSIVNNSSAKNGGAITCGSDSDPYFENCIIWGNTAGGANNQVYMNDEGSDPFFSFCDVQGDSSAFAKVAGAHYTGGYSNNLDTIPNFMNPSAGSGKGHNGLIADWKLQTISTCINAGDPNGGPYPATDIIGSTRIAGGRIDLGPYESTVNDIKKNQEQLFFRIYPNPSNGQFMIDSETAKENVITIYNALGGCVYSKAMNKKLTIDLKDQPKGIYYIHLYTNENSCVKKVVIQ